VAAVTRLGLYGGSRGLYGDFSTKEAAAEELGSTVFSYGQRERREKELHRFILEEDEILVAVISAFMEVDD
jgi:hypothetical protein